MTMGARIKALRKKQNMTQEELGEILGVKKSAIQKYESGEIGNIKRTTIKKMAETFNVSPIYLMCMDEETEFNPEKYGILPIQIKQIPMLGDIACGIPTYATEQRESYVEVGTDINADFCLRAQGDSMINARIRSGDIVFCRSQSSVDPGEIAVVIIEDEATLKRAYFNQDQQKLILLAENPKYEPLVYSGEELSHIKILGKAVAFQSDVL